MPVRIIFRGLILFELPESGVNKGKLIAQLINKRDIPNRPKQTGPKPNDHSAPHGPHEHDHGGRIQIATGDDKTDQLIPLGLTDREEITIRVTDTADTSVRPEQSFFAHVPRLSDVMDNASIDTVRRAAKAQLVPNDDLVRSTVIVESGVLRVRNIVTWDHGAFPLSGNRGQPGRTDDRGRLPASHAALKFVGSNWRGHMASDFVVDVSDGTAVTLTGNKGFKKQAKATGRVNHRVPYDGVEILITNYEVQEHTAVPWGLDFQWLFEAVGYPAADLAADFADFERLGRRFDPDVFDNDQRLLLEPGVDPDRLTRGRPFPYVVDPEGLETLVPVNARSVVPTLQSTDEEDRPICIGGLK